MTLRLASLTLVPPNGCRHDPRDAGLANANKAKQGVENATRETCRSTAVATALRFCRSCVYGLTRER